MAKKTRGLLLNKHFKELFMSLTLQEYSLNELTKYLQLETDKKIIAYTTARYEKGSLKEQVTGAVIQVFVALPLIFLCIIPGWFYLAYIIYIDWEKAKSLELLSTGRKIFLVFAYLFLCALIPIPGVILSTKILRDKFGFTQKIARTVLFAKNLSGYYVVGREFSFYLPRFCEKIAYIPKEQFKPTFKIVNNTTIIMKFFWEGTIHELCLFSTTPPHNEDVVLLLSELDTSSQIEKILAGEVSFFSQ